jgi:hypothetical protein
VTSIAIYGAGQLGTSVARILRSRNRYVVHGPYGRDEAALALDGGAALVIIATTSRLRDVAPDIARAIEAGSNVLVSAEECANPWLVDPELATTLDRRAREHGVTILGAGLNPGLIFDALVLTLLGAVPSGVEVHVTRVVDIGGFGPSVLARLGVGVSAEQFHHGVKTGEILGHAGFPQSMSIVARGLGLNIDRITEEIEPIVTSMPLELIDGRVLESGLSAGVRQTYRAWIDGAIWFTAIFEGHVRPTTLGWTLSDTIELRRDGQTEREMTIKPGLPSQSGSQAIIANSVDRVLAAPTGWLTIADLPPAANMTP